MIPITLAIIVENVSNPLHQVIVEQLPQVDVTFGIGDIVGSIALLVSAFTFYISYTRSSQSEQIKTSRELWESINNLYYKIQQEENLQENLVRCQLQIDPDRIFCIPYLKARDYR